MADAAGASDGCRGSPHAVGLAALLVDRRAVATVPQEVRVAVRGRRSLFLSGSKLHGGGQKPKSQAEAERASNPSPGGHVGCHVTTPGSAARTPGRSVGVWLRLGAHSPRASVGDGASSGTPARPSRKRRSPHRQPQPPGVGTWAGVFTSGSQSFCSYEVRRLPL